MNDPEELKAEVGRLIERRREQTLRIADMGRELNVALAETERMRKVLADWQHRHGKVPEGAKRLEAWLHNGEIVVLGEPWDVQPDDADGDVDHPDAHNCDAMGCGTFSHVIHRHKLPLLTKAV